MKEKADVMGGGRNIMDVKGIEKNRGEGSRW